ncbi:anaphase-promoting complex, cyclosome, subunit 4-domain-containing protein [Suillus clintonianus]|uniref:anaphase-promoting complex, cyclosome, subunit 4-domain-containing protein n=1 Tax=Suillus clintonianus TaxID=1904413 RepID=UPI001B867B8D|nr:anaphase-promoting complex, cyclosome, subunit 4-domain-containing protein [Suillus clintonianus]KAG2154867.1 anaphase-promoting complex, cyclosome, subunit 4-domain-containing protein [Suillus clintonianus]
MEHNAFASLAVLQLSSPCRLLTSACCPDKDLVVLVSRLGGRDRLTLWKMQGTKKWDIEVGCDESSIESVSALAWSPCGMTIAVSHGFSRITLHSVQDGHIERSLTIPASLHKSEQQHRITGAWWFPGFRDLPRSTIPDIFKRNEINTGSALSILKVLPLLDPLREEDHKLTATDLFAFQGTQTGAALKSSTPEVISDWPSLLPDPSLASLCPPILIDEQGKTTKDTQVNLSAEDENSLLVIGDDNGKLHCFLDGSYYLGPISTIPSTVPTAVFKDPKQPLFLLHPQTLGSDLLSAAFAPLSVDLPLLASHRIRDFARLSSAARELMWYVMRVIEDLREVWFGSGSLTGAREAGPKWIQLLETRLRDQFGQKEPSAIVELTGLLVAGLCSEGLSDFLSSSEQMSERALQKWESTVTDALVKLRDFSTLRLVPTLQRLHIILEEVRGWSLIPQIVLFGFNADDITHCLSSLKQAVFVSNLLAFQARRELGSFKHFLSFLRYEITLAGNSSETRSPPEHDILEVNHYLMSGLKTSQIDRWFTGPAPQFDPGDLGLPRHNTDTNKVLEEALEQAHAALQDPSQTSWQPVGFSVNCNVSTADKSHLDKNLWALVHDLAVRCQRVFAHVSKATARSAIVSGSGGATPFQVEASETVPGGACQFVRERVVRRNEVSHPGNHLQHLAIYLTSEMRPLFCLTRTPYAKCAAGVPLHIDVIVMECSIAGDEPGDVTDVHLCNAEFFDDEILVIVYKVRGTDGPMFAATVQYSALEYQTQSEGYVNGPARKDMIANVLQRLKEGHLWLKPIPIKRRRQLTACRDGSVSLAVNGRVGRRVVCILDGDGTTMDILDMEGDEDMEGEDETEMDSTGA